MDEKFTCKISAKGKTVLKASDIVVSGDLEVVNKDLVIATLTDASSKFDAEITVESGVGYLDAKNAERTEIGLIPLDCDFTPIEKISLSVEQARKGQATDWDAVLIGVTSDGSITPKDALLDHLRFFKNLQVKLWLQWECLKKKLLSWQKKQIPWKLQQRSPQMKQMRLDHGKLKIYQSQRDQKQVF